MGKTRRRAFLAGLISLMMLANLFPAGVLAVGESLKLGVNGQNILTAPNYTVACGSGTAVYDPAASTLTLDGATLNTLYSDAEGNWGCVIFVPNRDLTIVLKGANPITCSGSGYFGIQAPSSALTIAGDGTLDITSVRDCIHADEIVVDGAKLSLDGDNGLYARGGETVLHNKAVVTLRNGDNETPGIYGKTGVRAVDSTLEVSGAWTNGYTAISSPAAIELDKATGRAEVTSADAGAVLSAPAITMTNGSDVAAETKPRGAFLLRA